MSLPSDRDLLETTAEMAQELNIPPDAVPFVAVGAVLARDVTEGECKDCHCSVCDSLRGMLAGYDAYMNGVLNGS